MERLLLDGGNAGRIRNAACGCGKQPRTCWDAGRTYRHSPFMRGKAQNREKRRKEDNKDKSLVRAANSHKAVTESISPQKPRQRYYNPFICRVQAGGSEKMNQKKAAVEEVKERLETVSADLVKIMQCLEVLENSILHLPERKDKELSRPCAAAAEVILTMLDGCQEEIEAISCEL